MNKTTNKLIERAVRKAGMMPLVLLALLAPSAKAQTTVAIANQPVRIFAGAGVTNVFPGYTNVQVNFTLAGGTDAIDLYVTGAPAGSTAGLVTNGFDPKLASSILTNVRTTTTINAWLEINCTNAAKGLYPLTITASNEATASIVATVTTLLVVPVTFSAQIGSADTNWSTATNWSWGTSGAPVNGDDVKIQLVGANPQTNISFDTSATLDSFTVLPRGTIATNTLFVQPGVNIAINGTNGFWAGVDINPNADATERGLSMAMTGIGGSLIVTNPNAVFSMFGAAVGGGTKSVFDFSGLGNLRADVSQFGGGNGFLMLSTFTGTTPSQHGIYSLARTNVIRATYVGDYSGLGTMTNSIMFLNNGGNNNGNFASQVNLGITNAIYADSISVISHGSGNANSSMRFNPAFTNANRCVALFRSPSAGRMAFFGVGVDTGLTSNGARTRGAGADFRGGRVDMSVNTVWLGHSRSNFPTAGNVAIGNLLFDRGVIDVNTLYAGYHHYTNVSVPQSTITVGGFVGTNALLTVNTVLDLGHADFPLLAGDVSTPTGFGKLVINTNGVVKANTIIAGAATTANSITIAVGGTLILTNTIATPLVPLPFLSVSNLGHLVLNVTSGTTNCFVTNLADVVGAKLDIASLSGFSPTVPATNALISYRTAGTHNISLGTFPAGYKNVSIVDNTAAQVIEVRIQTNAPAVLRWKGFVNNQWNHTDANWQDTNTLLQVKFFDADSVIFDDAAGVPKSVSVTDSVIPNSGGTGIYMTNSANGAYSFENGGGAIGTCSMVKDGSANFTNNAIGTESITFNGGTLRGSGSLGGVAIASTAGIDYAGSVSGPTVISGNGYFNTGAVADGSFTLQGTASVTNYGTIEGGSLAVNGTARLVNQAGGWLKSIGFGGSANVAVGATLINVGDIGVDALFNPPGQANTLTVNGTFKEMGVGNIYLTTLTLNGGSTFKPGGDGIGTTQIKSASVGSGFPGRLTMLAGSTNIINVDFSNPQTNTLVVAQFTDFGGNTSTKAFDGCTVVMNNINTGAGVFANGQGFRVFTGPGGSDIGNEGLNTTNRYPIMSPYIPATNTKWDLSSLRDTSPNGVLAITGFPTTGTNITFSAFSDGTNLITHLQWDSSYIGWRLQQQTNSLSVGLYTNWTSVSGSAATNDIYITNSPAIDASFFRMVYP